MTTAELDSSRLEEFAGRMVGVVNDGLLLLSISIGHQTGLFDTMASCRRRPRGIAALAAPERYVREVLGCPDDRRYRHLRGGHPHVRAAARSTRRC